MRKNNKFANLYEDKCKILEKAPIMNKVKQFPPRQTKYPGGRLANNIFQ